MAGWTNGPARSRRSPRSSAPAPTASSPISRCRRRAGYGEIEMARYAVFGHPVAHSLSPRIHAMFSKQTGKAMSYEAIDVSPEDFAAVLQRFAAEGGRGANITLPHKQAAAALCARLTERATRAGAVNTITREGDGWLGDNTDGAGLV